MSFTFTDGDGNEIQEVWTCTECMYCSTKNHFGTDNGEKTCPMCFSPARALESITKETGLSDFEYRVILDWLQENQSGIGSGTIDSIKEKYPDGDDFLAACEHAYQEGEYDELMEISGVGKKSARHKLTLGLAEYYDWSGGKAEAIDF